MLVEQQMFSLRSCFMCGSKNAGPPAACPVSMKAGCSAQRLETAIAHTLASLAGICLIHHLSLLFVGAVGPNIWWCDPVVVVPSGKLYGW